MSRPLTSHIVLATDFSNCAFHAQEYVVLVAKAHDATLHVVHVPENPFWHGSHAATFLDEGRALARDTPRRAGPGQYCGAKCGAGPMW